MSAANRFSEMFQAVNVADAKPPGKKRGKIDFGAAMADDAEIDILFQTLHDRPDSPLDTINDSSPSPTPSTPSTPPQDNHTNRDTNRDANRSIYTDKDQIANRNTNRHTNQHIHRDTNDDKNRFTNQQPETETGIETATLRNIDTELDTTLQLATDTDIVTDTKTGSGTEIVSGLRSGMYTDIDPELWHPFTPNQGAVLLYLIQADGKSNRLHIAKDTGVPFGTVQRTVIMLAKHGYISKIERHYYHKERGFTYAVNQQKCAEFYQRFKNTDIGFKRNTKTGVHSGIDTGLHTAISTESYVVRTANVQTDIQTSANVPFSSSEVKSTTTGEPRILTGPEMIYWTELNLQEKQTQKWCEEFELTPDALRQQLAWARWDIVVNARDAKEPINWFYGALKKSAGCYTPAKGYQSPAMIRAANMKAQMEAEEQICKELADLTIERRFQEIMADQNSTEYQKLLAEVDDFARGQGGKTLERALKAIYLRLQDGQ